MARTNERTDVPAKLECDCIWAIHASELWMPCTKHCKCWTQLVAGDFLSHSMRGSIVCLAEVLAAELWFLWINWLSGHIHRVFCRQTQVCLAYTPSPSGHGSALAQKLGNWCWAVSCAPFQMARSRLRDLLQWPLQISDWISFIFLSVGARAGLNGQTQSFCAGDGNSEVVFSCSLSGHSLKIHSLWHIRYVSHKESSATQNCVALWRSLGKKLWMRHGSFMFSLGLCWPWCIATLLGS